MPNAVPYWHQQWKQRTGTQDTNKQKMPCPAQLLSASQRPARCCTILALETYPLIRFVNRYEHDLHLHLQKDTVHASLIAPLPAWVRPLRADSGACFKLTVSSRAVKPLMEGLLKVVSRHWLW